RSPLSLAGRRPQGQVHASNVLARRAADAPVAQGIADVLTELLDPNQNGVGTLEAPRDNWTLESRLGATPDRDMVRELVGRAAGVTARRFACLAPFDLVSANILLAPLERLARPLSRLLAPNARVILSGLLPSQTNAALAAYAAQGLRLEHRIPLYGWITLML